MDISKLKGKAWNKDQQKYILGLFDEKTLLTLYYYSNKGYIWEMFGKIKRGKEAGIFAAKTKDGEWIAIKIFRSKPIFKMIEYIRGDPRFKGIRKKDIVNAAVGDLYSG